MGEMGKNINNFGLQEWRLLRCPNVHTKSSAGRIRLTAIITSIIIRQLWQKTGLPNTFSPKSSLRTEAEDWVPSGSHWAKDRGHK